MQARAIAPCSASSSSSGRGRIATSNAAPSSIAFLCAEANRNSMSTDTPFVRCNSGSACVINPRMAPPLKILIVGTIARVIRVVTTEKQRAAKRRPFDFRSSALIPPPAMRPARWPLRL